jgi:hydroxymethylcytosylglucuronate/cytosylglucuronate synthase
MIWDCTIVLGGLLSPQQADRDGYVRAIVPSLLEALRNSGARFVKLIGNLSDDAVGKVRKLADECHLVAEIGYVAPSDFGRVLRQSALIAAQPGLMTLLEASASGRPLVRLPPQNAAGFVQYTAFDFIVGSNGAMDWPDHVIDANRIDALRLEGEFMANEYCYQRINAYTGRLSWSNRDCAQRANLAIREAYETPVDRRQLFARRTGINGAAQVASEVRRQLVSRNAEAGTCA